MPPLRVVFTGNSNSFSLASLKHTLAGSGESSSYEIIGVLEFVPSPKKYRGRRKASRFATLAAQQKVPYQGATVSAGRLTPEVIEAVQAFFGRLESDLACIVSGPILPPEVFTLPPLGFINVHPSLLPHYRGHNPFIWPLVHGCTETGVTVHQVNARIDDGDIYTQTPVAISPGIEGPDFLRAISAQAATLLHETLETIAQGRATPTPQKRPADLFYARKLKPGEKLVDWENWELERIYNFLRASYGLHYEFRPRYGIVWRAVSMERSPESRPPGTLYGTPRGFFVACKDGRIALEPIFVPARFRRNALEFLVKLKNKVLRKKV